jgi:hypothetical protein
MMSLQIHHQLLCSPEQFWQMLLDPGFARRLFCDELDFSRYDLIECSRTAFGTYRLVEAEVEIALPSDLRSVISQPFAYREESFLNPHTRRWTWVALPREPGLAVRMEGVISVEPWAGAGCQRTTLLQVDADVGEHRERIEEALLRFRVGIADRTSAAMNRSFEASIAGNAA